MTIRFSCPCGRALAAAESLQGKKVRCPACKRVLAVPSPSPFCPHCRKDIPSWDLPACPHCKASLRAGEEGPAGLPWEARSELGAFRAALQTIRQVLFSPSGAFGRFNSKAPLGGAFLFLALFGCTGALIGGIWNACLPSLASKLPGAGQQPDLPPALLGLFEGTSGIVIAPFGQLFACLLGAALAHIGLVMTGASRRDFRTTLLVFAYVDGAAGLLQALPFCGVPLSALWGVVCLVIALSHAHGCETWKAVIAVLWPAVLCCCGGVVGGCLLARHAHPHP